MIVNTDIDIDVADRNKLLTLIKHTPATINEKNKTKKHNTGVYFHKIPMNPFNGLSTIDYKEDEELGYFKLDILNVSIYRNITTKEQLDELLIMEPMWELLEHKEVVEQLFHVHNHFDIVNTLKPKSIEQLAAVLAIIRPAKRHLLRQNWNEIDANVWKRPQGNEYYFKKAHAFAYAHAIVLQLNMLTKGFSLQD